jgi:hypothetical protein
LISKGRFARRPVGAQSEAEPLPVHIHGDPVIRAGDKG